MQKKQLFKSDFAHVFNFADFEQLSYMRNDSDAFKYYLKEIERNMGHI